MLKTSKEGKVIGTMIDYARDSSEAEQRFRDLFGKEELEEARKEYFQYRTTETYVDFLKKKEQQKLESED